MSRALRYELPHFANNIILESCTVLWMTPKTPGFLAWCSRYTSYVVPVNTEYRLGRFT